VAMYCNTDIPEICPYLLLAMRACKKVDFEFANNSNPVFFPKSIYGVTIHYYNTILVHNINYTFIYKALFYLV
jgi:hypothetical protein